MMKFNALCGSQQLDGHDERDIIKHRMQTIGSEGRHADVIFLVCRGRNTVNTCRMRERFVLRGERSSGYLHHHETRIESAVVDQERRQPAEMSINQQRNTPF